jgi:hypothetical protein
MELHSTSKRSSMAFLRITAWPPADRYTYGSAVWGRLFNMGYGTQRYIPTDSVLNSDTFSFSYGGCHHFSATKVGLKRMSPSACRCNYVHDTCSSIVGNDRQVLSTTAWFDCTKGGLNTPQPHARHCPRGPSRQGKDQQASQKHHVVLPDGSSSSCCKRRLTAKSIGAT